MKYAMVLRNRVISVETSDTVPIYPPDAHGNQVIPVQCNESVVIGMYYNENTNSFYEPPEPEPPQPTQLDRIEGLLAQNVTDIENNAIDRYNLELVKEGVL